MYNASRHSFFTFHLNCLEILNSWLLVPLPLFKYISYMFTARGFAYLVQFAKLRLSQPHCFIHKPHMGKASLKKVEFCIKFAPNSTQIQRGTFTKISYSISCDMRNSASIRSAYCIWRALDPCFTMRSDVLAVAFRRAHDSARLVRWWARF